jgi:hypothetical protein
MDPITTVIGFVFLFVGAILDIGLEVLESK